MVVKKIYLKLIILLIVFLNNSFLYSEGKPATELIHKADTTGKTGLNHLLAYLYDYERFWYAVICTGSVVVFGLILTWIIGVIIKPKKHSSTI